MFIEAFRTRGPSYGDVIRQVIRELTKLGLENEKRRDREKSTLVYDVV